MIKTSSPTQDFRDDCYFANRAKRLRIPEKYADTVMSNYVTHTPSQAAAKQAVEDLVLNPQDQLLVISGPEGTGKTHLLCAALAMADKGRYVTIMDMTVRFNNSQIAGSEDTNGETEDEILEELVTIPLLAIDARIPTQEEKNNRIRSGFFSWFIYLFATRHTRSKPTILATDRSNPYYRDTCLGGILDKLVTSKISKAITIDGPDYRQADLNIKGGI